MSVHEGHRPGERDYGRVLAGVFLAGFATFAQLFDIQAVLPELTALYGVSPATAALTVSASAAGIAVSVLPWSVVADRIGRVTAMKIAIVVSAVLGVLSPWSPTFELLVGSRFLIGVALGAIPAVAMAYLAEEIHRGHIAATAGLFTSGNAIGALAGRLLAGFLGEPFGFEIGLAAVAVLTLVFGIAFALVVPRSRGFTPGSGPTLRALPRMLVDKLRTPALFGMFAVGFLLNGMIASVYNYVAFRVQGEPFDLPTTASTFIYFIFVLGSVATAIAGRLVQRLGRTPVLVGSALTAVVGCLVMLSGWLPVLAIGLALVTMGMFSAMSQTSAWVGQFSTTGRAQSTAMFQLANQVGGAVIGWATGLVFGAAGWTWTVASFVAAFLGVAAIVALGLSRLERDRAV